MNLFILLELQLQFYIVLTQQQISGVTFIFQVC